MKLKEKFTEILYKQSHDDSECLRIRFENIDKVVDSQKDIADEFATGLLKFIEGTYSYSNIFDYWYLHADTSKTYTKKQLLEIYKKQKGL
jgi:hypothetical protein